MKSCNYPRFSLSVVLVSALLVVTSVQPVSAAMIATGQAAPANPRVETLNKVDILMNQEAIQQQFVRLGVDPADAQARVHALTDVELAQLSEKLEEMPLGAGGLEVVGVVFLVLLLLELLGVIDIFKRV